MYHSDGNEVLIKSKQKYMRSRASKHGNSTSNNTKKKINMFHRGIPRIPGVTEFGKQAD